MAQVIIKLRVMPSSPDVNLKLLQMAVEGKIVDYGGTLKGTVVEPIAFGLKALITTFSMDENKGSTDILEEEISQVPDVESVSVIGVSRALG